MDIASPMNPLFHLVLILTNIIFWIIVVSVILSWLVAFNVVNVRHPFMGRVYAFINTLSEHIYRPIRKVIPTNFGGMDISPVVVLIALQLINYTVFWLHARYGV
jgi:YggT family protein